MDEYIDQLLAEMQMPEPALKVVRNILDEPMPETVKRRLLKPLFPKKKSTFTPTSYVEGPDSKVILEQFDPLPPQKAIRIVQDYQQEILEDVGRRTETQASLLQNAMGNRQLPARLEDRYP